MMKLNDFKKTGMFTCREDFEKTKTPIPPLHPDCTDVLVYEGGFYIECLKTNSFLLNIKYEGEQLIFSHDKLDAIEKILWEEFADKIINKKN